MWRPAYEPPRTTTVLVMVDRGCSLGVALGFKGRTWRVAGRPSGCVQGNSLLIQSRRHLVAWVKSNRDWKTGNTRLPCLGWWSYMRIATVDPTVRTCRRKRRCNPDGRAAGGPTRPAPSSRQRSPLQACLVAGGRMLAAFVLAFTVPVRAGAPSSPFPPEPLAGISNARHLTTK